MQTLRSMVWATIALLLLSFSIMALGARLNIVHFSSWVFVQALSYWHNFCAEVMVWTVGLFRLVGLSIQLPTEAAYAIPITYLLGICTAHAISLYFFVRNRQGGHDIDFNAPLKWILPHLLGVSALLAYILPFVIVAIVTRVMGTESAADPRLRYILFGALGENNAVLAIPLQVVVALNTIRINVRQYELMIWRAHGDLFEPLRLAGNLTFEGYLRGMKEMGMEIDLHGFAYTFNSALGLFATTTIGAALGGLALYLADAAVHAAYAGNQIG